MTIKVCVGSSCHLKGSYEVIEAFKEVLKKYDVEDVIDLQASFCLGHCALGVTVSCDGMEPAERGPQVEETPDGFILHSVNAGNVEELFAKEILTAGAALFTALITALIILVCSSKLNLIDSTTENISVSSSTYVGAAPSC